MEDDLLKFYRNVVAEKTDYVIKGKNPEKDESELWNTERDLSGLYDITEIQKLRQEILLSEIHTSLKRMDKSDLKQIASVVKDPLLDSIFLWLAMNDGIDNTSEEDFIKKFDPREFESSHMRIPTCIRPLVLLESVYRHPEKINELDELSSYFPQRMFIDKNKGSKGIL